MRTSIAAVALWAAILVTGAQGGQVVGHGTGSCAQWTEDERDSWSAFVNRAWLAGYLSGYFGYADDKIDVPDPAARNAWVSNYCQNHPLDHIWQAADHLILELKRRALRP
jgi:hypothetical protein